MSKEISANAGLPARKGRIRAPQDFVSGLALLALAAFTIWALGKLAPGTLRAMGPAMLPRALAAAIALCGVILVVLSFFSDGQSLGRWSIRAPFFLLLGIFAFALTIRSVGLLVAGPLAMIIGGFASKDVRWRELLIFAVVMTLFCAGLFRYALKLPIPILRIPGVVQL